MKMRLCCVFALVLAFWPMGGRAEDTGNGVGQIVGQVIRPLMAANGVPGMAVGVLVDGRSFVFDYGLASVSPRQKVTGNTLFEIGSISKTFAATLAEYAALSGDLSLGRAVSRYMPTLQGSAFDHVSLVDLGTHTPGGMPLQLPDGVDDAAQLMAYYRQWKPEYAPGTMRTYANPGIGLLGMTAAKAMNGDYTQLVQSRMFSALGLRDSFIAVPASQMVNYAEGYTADGGKTRLAMDPVGPEAFGVRTTAADLLRYLAINMAMVPVNGRWQQAVLATHTGYDQLQAGKMVQDLVWEQYDLPVSLAAMQAGNGAKMLLSPNPVVAFNPALLPRQHVLINKTGSTNGFAGYVAFIPRERIGIVLLANKAYPIPARVAAAYAILTRLGAAGLTEKP